ncbi:hypothetical protein BDF22DRAFT_746681 [Syncephalis plumigaleata]|nr:hypothetical protein BDF22DRAFT_746681 [Syncephalis plumigaleata]
MSGYWIKDTFWRGMAMVGLASSYPTHTPNANYHPAIIITGTSSGIGKEAALFFARQGYTVIATVRQEAHAKMLINEFNTPSDEDAPRDDSASFIQGGSLHPVILDLSGNEQIAEGWQRVEEVLRAVDVPLVALINNAGYGVSWVSERMSADYWTQAFWTNFLGAVELTRLALPRIRASKGRIINIGSIMSWIGVPCCSSYSAAKAALALWTRILRTELLPFEVAVTNIEPGVIETPGPSNALKELSQGLDQDSSDDLPDEYTTMTKGMHESIQSLRGTGIHPRYVAYAMAHAMQSPVPRDKYYVGTDAHLLAGFVAVIGESNVDALWRRMLSSKMGNLL